MFRRAPETSKQPQKPKSAPKPKPSGAKLEAAEAALETVTADYGGRMKGLADREAKLARERRELEEQHRADVGAAEAAVEAERQRYDAAMRQWRKGKSDT
ncbi:hypothetical protein [Sphingomonas sp. Ant20]|uniref:hypothetical protein n=1 Tax=Sphingomonas sp. Ant20 TaxID=104605 RepID=UPI000A7316C7|nr:hypothetical protein [Sphingomonas sp. Ant20]